MVMEVALVKLQCWRSTQEAETQGSFSPSAKGSPPPPDVCAGCWLTPGGWAGGEEGIPGIHPKVQLYGSLGQAYIKLYIYSFIFLSLALLS